MATLKADSSTSTELDTRDIELQYVYVPLNTKESQIKDNVYSVPYWKYADGLVTQRYYGDKSIVQMPYIVSGSKTVVGSTPRVTPITVSRSQSLPRVIRKTEGKALGQSESVIVSATHTGSADVTVQSCMTDDQVTKKVHKKRHKKKHNHIIEGKGEAVDKSVQTIPRTAGGESEIQRYTIGLDDDISMSSKRIETGSIASRITHNYYTGEQLVGDDKEHHNASISTSPYISYKAVGGRSAGYLYNGSRRMSGVYHNGEMNTLHAKCWKDGYDYTGNAKQSWMARYLYGMNSGIFGYRNKRSQKYGMFKVTEVIEGKTSRTVLTCCGCTCGTGCLPLQIIIIIVFLLIITFIIIFTISFLV